MAKPKVGAILDPNKEYKRDAIHVPIMSVVSGYKGGLIGGDFVYLQNGLAVKWYDTYKEKPVGVVDPFIRDVIQQGDKFYLFLKPESTLKLWHDWIHPLVDGKKKENKVL